MYCGNMNTNAYTDREGRYMSCMNCNRETTGTDVFCQQCQEAMVDFPVKAGTPAIIPKRPSPATAKKQPVHYFASAEEQLSAAQRTIRRLARSLVFVSLLLVLAAAALVYLVFFGVPDFLLNVAAHIGIA